MTWRALIHPNLLPLLGVIMSENQLVMVSEWMSKGNIVEFVRAEPNVDRLGLVGFSSRIFISLLPDDSVVAIVEGRY